jgi:beta-glucosidase
MFKPLFVVPMVMSFVFGCATNYHSPAEISVVEKHLANTPVSRTSSWWMPRHIEILELVKKGGVDLLMVGDSIIDHWSDVGTETWEKYYVPRNALNLGFAGDNTEHVLWRVENGEVDGLTPKLTVLMIGSNNSETDDYSADQIAGGIVNIIKVLREKMPKSKILLLNMFPRGTGSRVFRVPLPDKISKGEQWEKNNQIGTLAASEVVDDEWVFFLNINDSFLDKNGQLTRDVMPDLLHLNGNGYKIWAEAMEPTIKNLMSE